MRPLWADHQAGYRPGACVPLGQFGKFSLYVLVKPHGRARPGDGAPDSGGGWRCAVMCTVCKAINRGLLSRTTKMPAWFNRKTMRRFTSDDERDPRVVAHVEMMARDEREEFGLET